uniref:DDE Tnp4 domain-containing protein n=1 Tax=Brassica oleracea var. oleracea TaxID=109376 RepID=A0A0D3AQW6_BRAOL
MHCKQRWQKINDVACKLCGSYEAATREKTNRQNETDVLKKVHEIFCNNNKKKFNLEHRKLDDDAQSSASHLSESKTSEADEGNTRPPRVKASKARRKKTIEGKGLSEFQTIWYIKQQDMAMKERLSKMSLLGSLIAKREPLSECEEALKKKLINDLLAVYVRTINLVEFFRKKKDGLGRLGLSALQKCTAAIRVLAYGSALDTVDEYLRLGATTTRLCAENFVEAIINLFSDEYLRRPTPDDLHRLLHIGEVSGFSGVIGSIDCMHWELKNCPTAWKGTLNDLNVLDRSRIFDDIINGQAPQVNFSVNGRECHLAYYLTDGIYLKWTTFIQSIPIPQSPKAVLSAQRQEAVRKDVERAFGVLQARFALVKNSALFWG